jgi:hypothetical protein
LEFIFENASKSLSFEEERDDFILRSFGSTNGANRVGDDPFSDWSSLLLGPSPLPSAELLPLPASLSDSAPLPVTLRKSYSKKKSNEIN